MKHFKKILLSSLVTVSSSSYAEEVTFEFEGELGPNLNSGLFEQGFGTHPIGTKFTGYVIYDNDQVDQSPQLPDDLGFDFGKTKSSYAYTELSITIGNDTVIDYGGSIDVHDKIIDDPNSINSHSSDSIYIYSSSDTDATVGGLALDGISLWFVDNNGDAFNDQSLPNKIDLAKFSYGQIQLSNKIDYNSTDYDPEDEFITRGDISIDAQEVVYEFNGELNEAFGTHPSGTKYTASVVYDTNQEDQSPNDLTKGQYAYKKLSISIGDDVATDYGTGIIEVYNLNTDDPNDVNSHPTDLIRISSHDISAIVGGETLDPGAGLSLVLQDLDGTALKNISLPTGLNLSRFTIGNASFIELENEFAETITRGDLTLNPDEVFFKFEGELGSNINTDAGEGFGTHPPGSKFTGYLIYNINQVDQYLPTQEEIDLGLWEPNNNSKYSYKELSVTIGNDTATDYGPGYIHVNYQNLNDQDSLEYYPQDRISIYSSDLVGSLGGLTLDDNGIYLSLEDSTGSVFNDNSLPSELDITKFTSGYLKLESYVDHSNPSSDPSLQININSDIKINSDNTIEVDPIEVDPIEVDPIDNSGTLIDESQIGQIVDGVSGVIISDGNGGILIIPEASIADAQDALEEAHVVLLNAEVSLAEAENDAEIELAQARIDQALKDLLIAEAVLNHAFLREEQGQTPVNDDDSSVLIDESQIGQIVDGVSGVIISDGNGGILIVPEASIADAQDALNQVLNALNEAQLTLDDATTDEDDAAIAAATIALDQAKNDLLIAEAVLDHALLREEQGDQTPINEGGSSVLIDESQIGQIVDGVSGVIISDGNGGILIVPEASITDAQNALDQAQDALSEAQVTLNDASIAEDDAAITAAIIGLEQAKNDLLIAEAVLNHALLKEQQGEGNEISENEEDILKLILEKFTEAANSEDQLTRDVARLGDAVTLFDATLELDVINTADIERVKTYLSEAQTAIQQAEEETNDILSILDGTNDITENIKPLVTIAEGFIDVQETLRQAHAALEQSLNNIDAESLSLLQETRNEIFEAIVRLRETIETARASLKSEVIVIEPEVSLSEALIRLAEAEALFAVAQEQVDAMPLEEAQTTLENAFEAQDNANNALLEASNNGTLSDNLEELTEARNKADNEVSVALQARQEAQTAQTILDLAKDILEYALQAVAEIQEDSGSTSTEALTEAQAQLAEALALLEDAIDSGDEDAIAQAEALVAAAEDALDDARAESEIDTSHGQGIIEAEAQLAEALALLQDAIESGDKDAIAQAEALVSAAVDAIDDARAESEIDTNHGQGITEAEAQLAEALALLQDAIESGDKDAIAQAEALVSATVDAIDDARAESEVDTNDEQANTEAQAELIEAFASLQDATETGDEKAITLVEALISAVKEVIDNSTDETEIGSNILQALSEKELVEALNLINATLDSSDEKSIAVVEAVIQAAVDAVQEVLPNQENARSQVQEAIDAAEAQAQADNAADALIEIEVELAEAQSVLNEALDTADEEAIAEAEALLVAAEEAVQNAENTLTETVVESEDAQAIADAVAEAQEALDSAEEEAQTQMDANLVKEPTPIDPAIFDEPAPVDPIIELPETLATDIVKESTPTVPAIFDEPAPVDPILPAFVTTAAANTPTEEASNVLSEDVSAREENVVSASGGGGSFGYLLLPFMILLGLRRAKTVSIKQKNT